METKSRSPSTNRLDGEMQVLCGRPIRFSVGSCVDVPLRVGCAYATEARDGAPAWLIDLYWRGGIITGRALYADVGDIPNHDILARVRGVVRDQGDGPFLHVIDIKEIDIENDAQTFVLDLAWPQWIIDQDVVDRFRITWLHLAPAYRRLVNSMLSIDKVAGRFLAAPGSVAHHHGRSGGCIEHTVELAEHILAVANNIDDLDLNLALTGALIHDVGKAFEYERDSNGKWRMSEYGKDVGHKITGIQLLTLALAKCGDISSKNKRRLINILAGSYAAPWVGLRRYASREAELVAGVDRISAQCGAS